MTERIATNLEPAFSKTHAAVWKREGRNRASVPSIYHHPIFRQENRAHARIELTAQGPELLVILEFDRTAYHFQIGASFLKEPGEGNGFRELLLLDRAGRELAWLIGPVWERILDLWRATLSAWETP